MASDLELVRRAERVLGRPVSDAADAIRRLDAVADEALRDMLGDLLIQAERNEQRPPGWHERQAREKQAAQLKYLRGQLQKARDGKYGTIGKVLAKQYSEDAGGNQLDLSEAELEHFLRALQSELRRDA